MTVRCELIDYENKDDDGFYRRVIVMDAYSEGNLVRIRVCNGDTTVKVDGKELIEAVSRCMNAQWPY